MAVNMIYEPPKLAYSKIPFYCGLQTDRLGMQVLGSFFFEFLQPPVGGDGFKLEWEGGSIAFSFVATPVEVGELPVFLGGSSLSDYVAGLIPFFEAIESIIDDFAITANGLYLTFTHRNLLDFTVKYTNLSPVPIIFFVYNQGASAYADYPINSLLKTFLTDGTLLATQTASYNLDTKQTYFDIHSLFDVAPTIPIWDVNWAGRGKAAHSFQNYFLRYADRYGTPSKTDLLQKTGNYTVIYGAGEQPFLSENTDAIILLHELRDISITKEQPFWVYFFTKQAITNAKIVCTLFFSNDTSFAYVPPILPLNLEANAEYYFPSGFSQLQFPFFVAPAEGVEIERYEWFIADDNGPVSTSLYFDVSCDDCADWDFYLLFDTGLGGLETTRITGKWTDKIDVERETFRYAEWINLEHSGQLQNNNALGYLAMECNTGWREREALLKFRQILLGQVWFLDLEKQQIIAVTVTSTSAEVAHQDEQLFSFDFSIKFSNAKKMI